MIRRILPLAGLLILPLLASAQSASVDTSEAKREALMSSYKEHVTHALAAYDAREFGQSVEHFEKAFALFARPTPTDLYNAACSAALAGMTEKAYGFLARSIENGWEDGEHMNADADLASLRVDGERWRALGSALESAMKRHYGPDFDPALRDELLAIGVRDQAPRHRLGELQKEHGGVIPDSLMRPLLAEMARVDSVNLVRIREILDTQGWPAKARVGAQAGATVFLVIQHADLATQQHYLPLVEKAMRDGELHPSSFALLVDRIRVRTGKPQLYGSQLHRDEKTGATVFFPIEDEATVDERRKEVGLEPLADYARRFGIEYRTPSSK